MAQPDYEIRAFVTAADWRAWLMTHHADTDGIWLRMYKKATGLASVNYDEALDEALCFGWIDGQRKGYDERSFVQKFTPRRPRSLWSKRNIAYVGRLTKAGLMMPAGQAAIDAAKADGRWEAAYDRAVDMQESAEFLAALEARPAAKAFYATLNKTNRFAVLWRLQTARTEATRLRRQDKILDMLEAGQAFH